MKDIPIYFDGRHYDAAFSRNEDISFYMDRVREYGEPALELACGTGRLTIPLAREGMDITGLDISDSMLDVAREKAVSRGLKVEFVKGDMREFSLDRRFNTIMIPASSIQHLIDIREYEKLLANVRRHLTDTGRFIFQIFNPELDILSRDPEREYLVSEYEDPYGGGKVCLTEKTRYDSSTQVLHLRWYHHLEDELIKESGWRLRMIFPREMDMLLEYNGFRVEHKYGDFECSDFSDDSKTQIYVCMKKD